MQHQRGDSTGNPLPTVKLPGDTDLTVIVPTRNESANIAPLLERLNLALTGKSYEVLFVDDSTDETSTTIRRLAADFPFVITVIARPKERRNGLSGAVVEGIEAVESPWFCVIDADLQHPPELILRLLNQANRTGADIVVASRQADFLGPVGLSRARALTSQVLTILARMVFPRVLKNVSDPLTGFFLARRAAIDPTELQPDGFKILLEILVRHPDLRVTELHFDFAPRHEGQSKADLNEGIRFFRHLTRLRLTVNQHLIRFLAVVGLAVILNLSLLGGLLAAGQPVLRSAAVAGGVTIAGILLGEMWVFSDRPRGPARRRLIGVMVVSSIFLLAVYLPVIWLLAIRADMPAIVAGLAAMIVAGFVYYLFSEQWIWTRGLMMRPRTNLYYDIHGLLTVASQIPLNDLGHFQVPAPPDRIDLQLRVDRHGTPSRVPAAVCYDEQLGRFGFGLTVLPGEYSEIIVSPLLESSPSFLYTNVVEPVLRWMFIGRGFSLARAGGIQMVGGNDATPALLITGQPDMSYGLSRLCEKGDYGFMGDDRVLLGRDRRVYSFPKPVTANREMLPDEVRTPQASVALRLQRLLYSRPIRHLGLFLGERHLPAATVNTYLQRIIPQPKYPFDLLVANASYGDRATPATLIFQERGDGTIAPLALEKAVDHLLEPGERAFGFRPYPLLIDELARWGGRNWAEEERAILRAGLSGCRMLHWRYGSDRWWDELTAIIHERPHRASLLVNSA